MTTTNYFKTALLLGALTGLIVICGGWLGGKTGMLLALGLAGAMNLASYWFSDKIVLARYRAKPVSEAEAPRLHAILDRLVASAGIPKPALYVLPEKAPNAFATGRNPRHAAVAVTAGLLEAMSQEEVEGVIAHELGHIQNRDMLLQTVTATFAGAIGYLAQFGWLLGGRDEDSNPVAGLLMMILAPIAAMVIQFAISRQREFKADAVGAEICGQPLALAAALQKLDAAAHRIPMRVAPAAAPLAQVNPLAAHGGGLVRLFSTHPSTAERVARLEAMAQGR